MATSGDFSMAIDKAHVQANSTSSKPDQPPRSVTPASFAEEGDQDTDDHQGGAGQMPGPLSGEARLGGPTGEAQAHPRQQSGQPA